MTIEKEVQFQEVMNAYERENKENPHIQVGRDYINKCRNKRWYLGHLSHEDVPKVMVPGHEHGTVALVPRGTWRSVAQAAERYRQFKEQMLPCSLSVNRHENLDYSDTHVYLEKTPKELQHLDGFHRLISYSFFNRAGDIPLYIASDNPLL